MSKIMWQVRVVLLMVAILACSPKPDDPIGGWEDDGGTPR